MIFFFFYILFDFLKPFWGERWCIVRVLNNRKYYAMGTKGSLILEMLHNEPRAGFGAESERGWVREANDVTRWNLQDDVE